MYCNTCKARPRDNSTGTCKNRKAGQRCTNTTSSSSNMLCSECAGGGLCEGCGQMRVNSGAGAPGTVRPLGGS